MSPTGAATTPAAASARRRRPAVRIAATCIGVIAVGALVAQATIARGDDGPRYRTAVAADRDITEALHETAVIEPVSQAAVAFPVSGTVASVDVAVGDRVQVSTTLATLDSGSLDAAVNTAQAALDQAELTLQRALDGEAVTTPGQSPNDGPTAVEPTSRTTTAGDVVAAVALVAVADVSDEELRAAQQAVLDAQAQVDADLRTADEALASAREICAALGEPAVDDPATTSTTTGTTGTGDISACEDALGAVLDAQTTVQGSQAAVVAASDALEALRSERAASTEDPSPPPDDAAPAAPSAPAEDRPTGSGSTPTPNGPSDTPTPSAPSGGTTNGSSPSAEELVAYQKAVDAAEVDLSVAEQAVRQAEIRSPIRGTVVAVEIEPDDEVTAGSATSTITVTGEGGYEVTATVGIDDLPDLAVGQPATVTPDGSDGTPVSGEVVNIGIVGSTDGASTTYPVTIGLTGDSSDLRSGSIASVAISTDDATRALAVPTSAVHAGQGGHTVTLLEDGTASEVDVTVGAVGAEWTEITDGLESGQVVVLADLDEPLPGTATDSSESGPGGELRGTGGPPGGF
jgi:HlyD family secretion protein